MNGPMHRFELTWEIPFGWLRTAPLFTGPRRSQRQIRKERRQAPQKRRKRKR